MEDAPKLSLMTTTTAFPAVGEPAPVTADDRMVVDADEFEAAQCEPGLAEYLRVSYERARAARYSS